MAPTGFSIATALSPHCSVVAVEVGLVDDGELHGFKNDSQLRQDLNQPQNSDQLRYLTFSCMLLSILPDDSTFCVAILRRPCLITS